MSILREDFRPLSHQVVIFTQETQIQVQRVIKWLPPNWITRLSEPTVLGAMNLPPEVPRISWKNDRKPWSASVAPTAFTVMWRNLLKMRDDKLSAESFLNKTLPILMSYKKSFRLNVNRIACLSSRFARVKSPAKELAEHFCKPEWLKSPFNRPENFEIHSHKQFNLPGSEMINSWMRVKTAKLVEELPTEELVIVVEQDFNTPENTPERNMKDSDIGKFFKAAPQEMDIVFDLYFPPG
jgi:hypothetical protein